MACNSLNTEECKNEKYSRNMTREEKRSKYFFVDDTDFDNWWSTLDVRVEKKSFGEQENDIFKHSVSLKSFRNEYETDNLMTYPVKKLLLEGKIDLSKKKVLPNLQDVSLEVRIPGYNPNSFIPQTSSLTFSEMAWCQAIIEAGAPQTQAQLITWTKCKPILEKEQLHYMEYAKEQWSTDGFKKHAVIQPQVKELIDCFWKVRLERIYFYPKFYVQKDNLFLIPSTAEEVELKFVKQLESFGRPARYFIPDLWTFVVNINSATNLISKPEIGWSLKKKDDFSYYKQLHPQLIQRAYHPDVSKDSNATRLAKDNCVNIVMSSSAFLCLVDSQAVGLNSAWSLPITIIEYKTDHGVKKLAFIDKKLPPQSMTAVERNKYFAKLALKKLLVNMPRNYRDPAVGIYDADLVETFGIDSSNKGLKYPNLKKRKKIKCYNCQLKEVSHASENLNLQVNKNEESCASEATDSDDSSCFHIDSDDENKLNNDTKQTSETKILNGETSKDAEVASNSKIESDVCTCKYEWIEEKDNSSMKKKKRLNYKIVYNLWDFNSSASQNYMSKNCSKDLKVLIRSTIEGQVIKYHDSSTRKPYKLSPKLEYQTEFGAEAASLSEVLRDWASVHIRPSTTLARVRIDAVKGDLIQIQCFTPAELAAECVRLHNVNPKDRLVSVHSILVKISDLSPGNYLLCLNANNGMFVDFYKSVERGGGNGFNLHLRYNIVDSSEVSAQRSIFTPLDTAVKTPTFQHFKRLPCTFVPKKNKQNKSNLRDNTAVNPITITTGKIKKKKKKKKTNSKKKTS